MKTFYLVHEENVVSLNIDILSICNFKCPYCYNSKKYHNIHKLLTLSQIQYIVNDINSNENDILFDITLVGGEPFLHPQLEKIIEMFSECEKVRKIDIFTNGSIIKNLKRFAKVRLYISIHPECNFKKVDALLELNNVDEVSFMIFKNFRRDKYLEYSKKYPVAHTFIVSLSGKLHYNDLNLPNKDLYHYNDERLFVDEVYSRKINRFKDWNCLFSIIDIDVTGKYGVNCVPCFDKNIFSGHFIQSFKPEFRKCQLNECNEDCYLGCYKYLDA